MARGGTTGGNSNRSTQSSLQRGGGHARRDGSKHSTGRKKNQQMSDEQVVGFLGNKIRRAMNSEDGDLAKVRQENFNYYMGDEYGGEREGYSKFVTRETLETVEWVLPSVLKVFLSGDRIVSFDAVNAEDEHAARQETDLANYFVMRANNGGQGGFLPLHHWMKDCLMYPNGYVKVYMEERKHTDVGVVKGVNAMGVQMLENDPEVEILEQRTRPSQLEAEGNVVDIEVYDLRIRTTKDIMELRIVPVPPEEALVDNDCTSLNLDEADFVCHRVRKTYTQLVLEGHPPEELDQVGSAETPLWNDERVNRLFYEDEDPDAEGDDDASMRQFWVHECYAWFDYDGDGVAEHRMVTMIGDRVFSNEETNYQPLIAMSAILMPHKHNGMSYIDIMKDLQLLQSILTRQMLDNIYKLNVRKKFISEDSLTEDGSTMEAMLNTQAEFIPVRGMAANAVMPDQVPSMVGEILPVLQFFNEQQMQRTGVSPEATVSGNDLQEVRQDVMANALDRASQRIEMLVRIFSETGYRQLMLKTHQLLRSHWDIEKSVKLRGDWVEVDPQGWRDRTAMSINVGLGYNTKQTQLGLLTSLLEIQKEASGVGMADGRHIYHTAEKLVAAAGLGDPSQYFIDPDSPDFRPPEPPPPDPNMIMAQAQAQALGQEQARKGQEMHINAQHDAQKLQADQAGKQIDNQLKRTDQQIKLRELALKEKEMIANGQLKDGEIAELAAKISNIEADTLLKHANADKTMAEATVTAIEGGETYNKALEIVSESGETADGGGGPTAEFDSEDSDNGRRIEETDPPE